MSLRSCGLLAALVAALINFLCPASVAHAGTLTFDLNNSYASNENPAISLTPHGGTLGATGYAFAAGQGLTLDLHGNPKSYAIEMKFEISSFATRLSKILDFSNRVADPGLYVFETADFVHGRLELTGPPRVTGRPTFKQETIYEVAIRRDESNNVSVVRNGVTEFTTADPAALYNGSILNFFAADATYPRLQSPGFVDAITITFDLSEQPNAPHE